MMMGRPLSIEIAEAKPERSRGGFGGGGGGFGGAPRGGGGYEDDRERRGGYGALLYSCYCAADVLGNGGRLMAIHAGSKFKESKTCISLTTCVRHATILGRSFGNPDRYHDLRPCSLRCRECNLGRELSLALLICHLQGGRASLDQLMIVQVSAAVAMTTRLVVAATEVVVVSGGPHVEHLQQVCSSEARVNCSTNGCIMLSVGAQVAR